MSHRNGPESEPGIGERVRRVIRRLGEFAYGFHQGISQVQEMNARRDERVESESSADRETEPDSVPDGEGTDETR